MGRAGIDPRGIPEMFRILIAERNRGGAGNVESWFATHPMEEDRIAATEAEITKISPTTLARLTKDSPRYQSFKQRLASLPVAASRNR